MSDSFVYFIQQGIDGPIKIGLAENPDVRLLELQVANAEKLYLRGVLRGGMPEEKELHKRFRQWRVRGEWFRPDAEGLQDLLSVANHDEFWGDDELLCEECQERPVPLGRRKYCDECGDRLSRRGAPLVSPKVADLLRKAGEHVI